MNCINCNKPDDGTLTKPYEKGDAVEAYLASQGLTFFVCEQCLDHNESQLKQLGFTEELEFSQYMRDKSAKTWR